MIEDIKKDATARMQKSLDSLKQGLTKLRTGRANTALLEHVRVDYYGNETPLSQVASVVVEDARTISISPWEKNMVQAVEKAILASDLGLTPNTAGTTIRISMPPLTEERRRDLTKIVKSQGEDSKVAIRNLRREANEHGKKLLKDKEITEDEERRLVDDVQKLTDRTIAEIDKLVQGKEAEILAV